MNVQLFAEPVNDAGVGGAAHAAGILPNIGDHGPLVDFLNDLENVQDPFLEGEFGSGEDEDDMPWVLKQLKRPILRDEQHYGGGAADGLNLYEPPDLDEPLPVIPGGHMFNVARHVVSSE